MSVTVNTLAELEAEAARFVGRLAPSPRGATLVTLSGELGAGKTAFVQAVARVLGVKETVTSPTFVLEKIYELPAPRSGAGFSRLIHIDAYRLESGVPLTPLGLDELMRNPANLILLEWPERVAGALPTPSVRISLERRDDDSRIISYI